MSCIVAAMLDCCIHHTPSKNLQRVRTGGVETTNFDGAIEAGHLEEKVREGENMQWKARSIAAQLENLKPVQFKRVSAS